MKSPAADDVLGAVRSQLRLRRVADALRFAAWVTVAIALVAVLLHLFVRPVSLAEPTLVVAIVWVAAILQAITTPTPSAECAAWADRHLGGASAYATFLELPAADHARVDSSAITRLEEWIAEVAPGSLAKLQSIPLQAGLKKPVAVAFVGVALAAVLLQVPMQRSASTASTSAQDSGALPTLGAAARGEEPEAATEDDAASASSTPASAPRQGENARDGVAPVRNADDQRAAAADRSAALEPATAATRSRAASGGQDAGDSPDTSADAGLSEAWQGAMASQLRSLPAPAQEAARTDATLAADFTTGRDSAAAATAIATFAPAAAVAPDARRTPRLGPAEQAYVRAYFAGSGATP
jgi:hypothetical protein